MAQFRWFFNEDSRAGSLSRNPSTASNHETETTKAIWKKPLFCSEIPNNFRLKMAELSCKVCKNFVSTDLSEYKNHFRTEHKKMLTCLYCDYQAPYQSVITNHTNSKHLKIFLNCTKCMFKCTQQSSLNRHEKVIHEKISKKCPTCSDTFCTESGLTKHIKNAHVNLLQCNICSYSTKNAKTYRKHTIQHNARFECNDCQYYTNNKSNLNRHQKSHLKKNILCSLCFYSTNRADYLKNHVKKYHKNVECNNGSDKPDYVMPL